MKNLFYLTCILITLPIFGQPILFRENKGQFNESILAEVQNTAFKTKILKNGFSYADSYKHEVSFLLQKANTNATLQKLNPTIAYSNYFKNGESYLHVKDFQQLKLFSVLPKIDWHLYSNKQHMEYDFILHPGAEVESIRIQITSKNIRLDEKGALHIGFGSNEMVHLAPVSFQGSNIVESSWKLLNDSVVGFELGEYDRTKDLVIDPIALEWYQQYIFANDNVINSSVVDENDNIYIIGTTIFDDTGESDMFLSKADASGELLMNVFIGDNRKQEGHGIALDSQGNIFVSGSTTSISTDINTYILKLTPTGEIIWEESFGQSQMGSDLYDYAYRCSLDSLDNLYIGGLTRSNAISTPGAYQETMSSTKNVFLAKYNANNELLWRTYTVLDAFADFECDKGGNCFVYGRDGGTTLTILKFNADGQFLWNLGNQLAQSSSEFSPSFCISPDGQKICFVGSTQENLTQYTTTGVHQNTNNGQWDGIITVIDSSGARLWASYFGGPSSDFLIGCSISNEGELLLAGTTNSTSDIATEGSYSTSFDVFQGTQSVDAFFAKFDASGNRMFATYYNGIGWKGDERGSTCHFTSNPEAYFVTTNSHLNKAEILKFKESGLSVPNNQKQSVYSFKNQGSYFIHSSSNIGKFDMVNQEGKRINSQHIDSNTGKLDVENLSPGIYFLIFENSLNPLKIMLD